MELPVDGETICSLSGGNVILVPIVFTASFSVLRNTETEKVLPTVKVPVEGLKTKEAASAVEIFPNPPMLPTILTIRIMGTDQLRHKREVIGKKKERFFFSSILKYQKTNLR